MAAWQLFLFILLLLAFGTVLVITIFHSIHRRKKNKSPDYVSEQQKVLEAIAWRTVAAGMQTKHLPDSYPTDKLEQLMQKRRQMATAKKPIPDEQSDIVDELRHNLSIATTPYKGKLLPFQTTCWENNHYDTDTLINHYNEELIQVYKDIHLANVIVWLSNDLIPISLELEKSYLQLCNKIGERLEKVILR